ncbi:T9SS type A sorting domain-containing protein [Flagellimonas flava]|uniref:Por secretion system C-terminal sorting domain-containing protein n=1 Tax=Flagellimonas flava TaxID=570519 RepID=A0A1M5J023_9FLAO|nr:T9SS type A sorting domain-containing protein [Allomuricauda flava]SHG33958.1 Por secretion system C-terminal sorting domain-containing protein [Allomuricauda flava]
MRKITFLILLHVCTFLYSHENNVGFENEIEVVEIKDEIIDGNEFYCEINYSRPTILVFPNLTSVKGTLAFCYTTNLVGIEAPLLENVEVELLMTKNEHLIDISFPQLQKTTDYLVITENPSLKKADFPLLEYVGASFSFIDNPKLESVKVPKLKTTCERVSFQLNPSLVELDFPSLTNIGNCGNNAEHGGEFEFSSNESLNKINAPILETAGGINLYHNLKLESFETSNLVVIETDIHIHNNANLKELKLQKLKSVGIDLHISSNDSLKAIDLQNLSDVGVSFVIHANYLLEYLNLCSYVPPVIQYDENNIPIPSFPEFHLSNNPVIDQHPFCPDQKPEEEVEEEDFEDNPKVTGESIRISLHPNPAEDIVHIDSEIEFSKVEIYDLSGNLIKSLRPNSAGYDVSDIAAGMYIMIIYHKDSIYGTIEKLVIR